MTARIVPRALYTVHRTEQLVHYKLSRSPCPFAFSIRSTDTCTSLPVNIAPLLFGGGCLCEHTLLINAIFLSPPKQPRRRRRHMNLDFYRASVRTSKIGWPLRSRRKSHTRSNGECYFLLKKCEITISHFSGAP